MDATGAATGSRSVTLWLEALAPSGSLADLPITLSLDPDGDAGGTQYAATDQVRCTAVDVDVLIGASDANDESVHDDWVAARTGESSHRILNFIRVQGPSGMVLTLTSDWNVIGDGTPTIILEQPNARIITIAENGLGSADFTIAGGSPSKTTEDVRVYVTYGGQVFGEQTLTVIKFNAEPETCGPSPIPVNPAYVTWRGPLYGGNLFAADIGSSATEHGTGSLGGRLAPDIKNSPKIAPRLIEVTWARFRPTQTISQLVRSSEANSGLEVSPANNALPNNPSDNLRMRDCGILQTMGNTPENVQYLMGHPTEYARSNLSIQNNHAVRIDSVIAQPIIHPVAVHVMELRDAAGTIVTSLNLTVSDIDQMLRDLNTVWSQAGIEFVLPVGNLFLPQNVTDPTLIDVDDSFLGRTTDNVTATNNIAGAIDVYFVRRIGDDSGLGQYPGVTIYNGLFNSFGMLVAKETTGPQGTVQTRDLYQMLRTLAHEMGHYLLKVSNNGHRTDLWNIMSDDSDIRLDIDKDQAFEARKYVVGNE